MKIKVLIGILSGMFLCATAANASSFQTAVQFNVDGAAGYDVTGVKSIDWHEDGVAAINQDIVVTQNGVDYNSTLAAYFGGFDPNVTKTDGDRLRLDLHAQARLETFTHLDGSTTTVSGYEITMGLSMTEYATYSTALGGDSLLFNGIESGEYAFFYQNSADADIGSGAGYTNGTEILRGTIETAVPGSVYTTTALGSTGSTNLINTVDSYDEAYINTDPSSPSVFLSGTTFHTTLQLFTPSDVVIANGATIGLNPLTLVNVDGTNDWAVGENALILKADANTTQFSAVPEPATIGLFGLGLLGLASISRRKNN